MERLRSFSGDFWTHFLMVAVSDPESTGQFVLGLHLELRVGLSVEFGTKLTVGSTLAKARGGTATVQPCFLF